MSYTVGQLMIEMAANVARLRTDMDAAWRTVDRSTSMMAASMKRVENIINLGLGGAAVGAAASFGRSLYEASAQAERLASTLNFATGGNGARELAYVSEVANRLGLDFNSTAQAYANFAAASRGTNIEGTQTQAVFEAVAKASAVMGLTTDNTRGVLLALQQMMSKGTVSAEELRGQLGERLPGAFQIAARAMGVTTQELGKMLEQGQVISDDFLPRFARQMESELGGSASNVAERLDAATNRMGNAWERLKKTIGDSGVSSAMASLSDGVSYNMQAVSDAMDRAKVAGHGFFGQMYNGTYMLAGRAVGLHFLSSEFESLAERVRLADQRLAELKVKAEQGWGVNIYFKADLASAKAEVEALQALQIAMGQRVAGAGRGNGQLELDARRNQYTTPDPYAGAKALDEVRKGAKLRQDIQMAEGAKAVEIAKAFGKAIADAGENPAYAAQLAAERDARLIALRRDTHAQLEAFDKSHSQRTSAVQRKQVSDFAQVQKKVLEDMAKDSASAQAELMGLGRAQEQFLALAGSPEWERLSNAQRAVVAGLYEERIAREQANNGVRAALDLRRELARIALDEVDTVAARVAALQEETARIGLTAADIAALEQARTNEALAAAQATLAIKIASGARGEEIEAVTLLVEQLGELSRAQQANTAAKAAKDAADEWRKTAESIEKDMTDALMRAFESGKGFAQSFRDVLANTFKTQVLRPLISSFLNGGSGTGSGGFNLGSLTSLFGGSGSADFLAGMRGASLSSGLAGPTTMGAGGAMGAGAGVGGAMGSVASFAPYAAMIYMGMQMSGSAYDKGFNARNLPWTKAWLSTGGIAPVSLKFDTMTLEKLGVNSRLANQITGASLWSRAFGRADPKSTGSGIEGTFGGGSFSGQAFNDWLAKGGWFSSDKSGTDYSALDAKAAVTLGDSSRALLKQVEEWAKTLSLPATSLAQVTSQMKVKLTGDATADQQALDAALSKYQEALAQTYAAPLAQFAKVGETIGETLKRVSTLQTFSEGLNNLGGVFGRVAGLGWQTRESFIELAGGMDALMQQANGFAQNYYTRDEIAGVKARELAAALAAGGIDANSLAGRDQYRALVESMDVSTVAGREQLALLLKLQGDFAQVGDYLNETGQSLADAAAQAPATSVLQGLLSGTQAEQQSQKQVDATLTVAAKVDGLAGLMQQTVDLLGQLRNTGGTLLGSGAPAWEVNA